MRRAPLLVPTLFLVGRLCLGSAVVSSAVVSSAVVSSVVVSSVVVVSVARAQAPQSIETVTAMLMGIDDAPSLAEWRALGPSVLPVLASIASSAQQPGFVRIRAIQAVSAFPTPAARTVLRRALRSSEPLIVREAALSMQRAFGAAALRDVAPLLGHRDTAVREAAIRALGAMGTEAARSRLRARLPRETDEVMREEIQRALTATTTTTSGGDGATTVSPGTTGR